MREALEWARDVSITRKVGPVGLVISCLTDLSLLVMYAQGLVGAIASFWHTYLTRRDVNRYVSNEYL